MPKILTNPYLKGLMIPLIAGLVLSILAPFGTYQFDPLFRVLYWVGLTLAGGLGAILTTLLLKRFLPGTSSWLRVILQSLGATLAVAPFVIGLHVSPSLFPVLLTLFYIWVVAIVITAVGELAGHKRLGNPNETIRPPLLDRLPPKFRDATLYAISSEDHYVRIHSAAGEHMILMRLSDAEDLAAPITGLKPHRSWWVAESGVASIEKLDGKLRIRLKSGADVPVSREGGKRVREAGWI